MAMMKSPGESRLAAEVVHGAKMFDKRSPESAVNNQLSRFISARPRCRLEEKLADFRHKTPKKSLLGAAK
jgi:hypothetical protein